MLLAVLECHCNISNHMKNISIRLLAGFICFQYKCNTNPSALITKGEE